MAFYEVDLPRRYINTKEQGLCVNCHEKTGSHIILWKSLLSSLGNLWRMDTSFRCGDGLKSSSHTCVCSASLLDVSNVETHLSIKQILGLPLGLAPGNEVSFLLGVWAAGSPVDQISLIPVPAPHLNIKCTQSFLKFLTCTSVIFPNSESVYFCWRALKPPIMDIPFRGTRASMPRRCSSISLETMLPLLTTVILLLEFLKARHKWFHV